MDLIIKGGHRDNLLDDSQISALVIPETSRGCPFFP